MRMDRIAFEDIHETLYLNDPCGYAPFAHWKMQALLEDAQAYYLPPHGSYFLVRGGHLLIHSSPDGRCHIEESFLNQLDCISMKASAFEMIKDTLRGFDVSYNEILYYDFGYVPKTDTQSAFRVMEFDFAKDEHYQIAADIINEHEGGMFGPDNIRKMTSFPTFDPQLWFFVQDAVTEELIGIGISTYHPGVMETDLDWIYIRTKHQGRGAGQFMMQEIVRRSKDRSRVIRVGGTVAFYKKCGFYTKELWAWAAKPGYSFHAPAIQPNILP